MARQRWLSNEPLTVRQATAYAVALVRPCVFLAFVIFAGIHPAMWFHPGGVEPLF